jgi:acyl-CoA synthetase (AMP-forming)/AMP-acid ligase II
MAQDPGGWAGEALLAGDPGDRCLWMGGPVARGELATAVDARLRMLQAAGLRPGGTVAIALPPSLEYVAVLLAAWRAGAQVSLLDHRLVRAEVEGALDRLAPQVVVTADGVTAAPMAGYAQVVARADARPGGRAARPDPAQLGIHRAVEGHRQDRRRPAGRAGAVRAAR